LARQAVCISHATGAGGAAVGRAVAERLGFRYVDDEVIAEAAEWAELDPALVADAERRKPFVSRLLGQMAEGSPPQRLATGGWARTAPTDADLRVLITDVLRSFADGGSVVIVSHAASFALAGRDVLRVFVTASDQTRARRVAEATGTAEGDGAKQVRKEDGARADYLKRFYAVDRELPTHFDIVVNTDVLTPEKAADVIAEAAT
jgi:cytidylate kinase